MRSFSFSRQRKKEEENLSLFLFSFLFSHRNKKKPLPLGELLGELAHGLERLDVGLGCFCCSIRGERLFSTKREGSRESTKKKKAVSAGKEKKRTVCFSFSTILREPLSLRPPRVLRPSLSASARRAHRNQGGGKKRRSAARARRATMEKNQRQRLQPRGPEEIEKKAFSLPRLITFCGLGPDAEGQGARRRRPAARTRARAGAAESSS